MRKARLTPTDWGSYSGSLTPLPSIRASPEAEHSARRTRSLSSLIDGDHGRASSKRRDRSPEIDSIEWFERRARRTQEKLDADLEALRIARIQKRKGGSSSDKGAEHGPTYSDHRGRQRSDTNKFSEGSDDTVVPGYAADGAISPTPQPIVTLIKKKWSHHFSLAVLTDAHCSRVAAPLRSGKTTAPSASSPSDFVNDRLAEEDMSYDEWTQAWRRLFDLLQKHMSRYVERWRWHYNYIDGRPSRSKQWRLWLAYDIQLRQQTRQDKRIDVMQFHMAVWNDILSDHLIAAKTEEPYRTSAIEAARQEPRYHRPNHSWRARDTTALGTQIPPPYLQAPVVFDAGAKATLPTTAPPIVKPPGGPFSSNLSRKESGRSTAGNSATNTTDRTAPANVETATLARTYAPSVAQPPTPPNPASVDPRRVVTPFIASAWEKTLSSCNLLHMFPDVPDGIAYGFRIGSTAPLLCSSTPPNHKSALDNPSIVEEAIAVEVAAGRYSGPFSASELEAAIGPFRSAPLGVVAKSTPGEFRIIQDFSFPRDGGDHPALNAEIDPDAFKCEWGFFSDVVATVLSAPAGTEAGTMDVWAAYRRVPVHTRDQHNIVVAWNGKFWIDHCVPFGAVSSNGLFGRVGDAMALICAHLGFGPVLKWVDDFLFFRFPQPNTPGVPSYTIADITALAESLGWPWKESKTRPFNTVFIYLGFEWDLAAKSVRIPSNKRQKYLKRVEDWLSNSRVSLRDTEVMVGSLVHCTQVVTGGRPHLAGLMAFSASFGQSHQQRFQTRTPPARAQADAKWWCDTLRNSTLTLPLRHPLPQLDMPIFMDASTSFGIGVTFDGCVASWKLADSWRRPGVDIGWAEMAAVELSLSVLIGKGIRNHTVVFHSDNNGVVFATQAGRSRNEHQNAILMRILATAEAHDIDISISYIRSAENPADAPSRGVPTPGLMQIDWSFEMPPDLAPFMSRVYI